MFGSKAKQRNTLIILFMFSVIRGGGVRIWAIPKRRTFEYSFKLEIKYRSQQKHPELKKILAQT